MILLATVSVALVILGIVFASIYCLNKEVDQNDRS